MEHDKNEPNTSTVILATPSTRHGGWSGEKMAKFCELLAETAVVAEACDQVGMHISGAYALRRRNPVFAAGWDAALTIARERLADTLLARAMEGNAEYLYRDGEVVGRREVLDNRLGLAILRRLDRLAETGRATSTRGERPPQPARPERSRGAAIVPADVDWQQMVDALRSGEPDDIAGALAVLKSYEVEEVEDPPNSLGEGDSDDDVFDLSDRCWYDDGEQQWMTDFVPPPGFDGYEEGEWDELDYKRSCTPEEVAILEADRAAQKAAERAEDELLRERWFAILASSEEEDSASVDEDDQAGSAATK